MTAYEYRITRLQWMTQPDPKKIQEDCDKMALEGWRLIAAHDVTGSGGGSVVHYWERERI